MKRAEEAAPLKPVFVHGWVYDLESGTVTDLNISTGPKGFEDFVPSPTEETRPGETSASTPASTASTIQEPATETSRAAAAEPTLAVVAAPQGDVEEVGHSTIPVKRSNMLARLRRSLPPQRSYGKRFSRQI